MDKLQDLTEVIVASWILSGGESRMPSSHGLMDRALKTATERGAFGSLAEPLHFADSRVGLQCVELPAILDWAQRSQLTTAPNPSYHFTEVQISSRAAQAILADLGISPEDAIRWGNLLREGVKEARHCVENHIIAGIEEY